MDDKTKQEKMFRIGDMVTTTDSVIDSINRNTSLFEGVSHINKIIELDNGFTFGSETVGMSAHTKFIHAREIKKFALGYVTRKLEFVANHIDYEVGEQFSS